MLPFYYLRWDLCVLHCGQPPRELLVISSEGTDGFVFGSSAEGRGAWHR